LTLMIGTGERLIPRTSDRLVTDFTSDEKRALYDYVIAHTEKPDIGRDIADINNLKPQEKKGNELSFLELLVQERNLKRRRAKHRGVHTNKKSHTEILREVINQQMETYAECISGASEPAQAVDVQNVKTKDSNHETMQERGERLYKVFHSSYDNFNSREKNGQHYGKRNDLKRERSEERRDRSRERDKRKRYSDECNETYKKREHSGHRKSSRDHSKDRKSHKKDKHRSKSKHKDKHHERKHKSRDRDRSSERHRSKHGDYKRKMKDKEY
ncbi:U11/U12 small nuclear ribonucleoprotein 48 kDa protein, partial [Ooceraea biroi]